LFMKSCYADTSLAVSNEEFEQPENLSIEVDCEKYTELQNKNKNLLDAIPEIDF